MINVRDLLSRKNSLRLPSVFPRDSVATALSKMAENNLGAILVMENEQVVGIFSERDYARKLLLFKKSSLVTPVKDVMVKRIIYVTPDYSLEECLALMTKKHIRHLPVMDGSGSVHALISIEDVVEAILDGKEFIISELTRYVTGSPTVGSQFRLPSEVKVLSFSRPNCFEEATA